MKFRLLDSGYKKSVNSIFKYKLEYKFEYKLGGFNTWKLVPDIPDYK